jgi:hypothetical protein
MREIQVTGPRIGKVWVTLSILVGMTLSIAALVMVAGIQH